jgi:hypothetical protein
LSLADNTELAEVALAVRERLMAALGQVAEAGGALSTTAG